MRAAIQRNDASFVDHFLHDHYIAWTLNDLEIVVVTAGQFWRAAREAAFRQVAVQPRVGGVRTTTTAIFSTRRSFLLTFRSERREPAIRWIDDQRSSL